MITELLPRHIDSVAAIEKSRSREILARLIAKPAFNGLVMLEGVELVGFIYGFVIKTQNQIQGEVIEISVAHRHRCKGYGQRLLQAFLSELHLQSCWLEVRSDNFAALNLYKKLGFVEGGVRKGYYQSAHALLMQWSDEQWSNEQWSNQP